MLYLYFRHLYSPRGGGRAPLRWVSVSLLFLDELLNNRACAFALDTTKKRIKRNRYKFMAPNEPLDENELEAQGNEADAGNSQRGDADAAGPGAAAAALSSPLADEEDRTKSKGASFLQKADPHLVEEGASFLEQLWSHATLGADLQFPDWMYLPDPESIVYYNGNQEKQAQNGSTGDEGAWHWLQNFSAMTDTLMDTLQGEHVAVVQTAEEVKGGGSSAYENDHKTIRSLSRATNTISGTPKKEALGATSFLEAVTGTPESNIADDGKSGPETHEADEDHVQDRLADDQEEDHEQSKLKGVSQSMSGEGPPDDVGEHERDVHGDTKTSAPAALAGNILPGATSSSKSPKPRSHIDPDSQFYGRPQVFSDEPASTETDKSLQPSDFSVVVVNPNPFQPELLPTRLYNAEARFEIDGYVNRATTAGNFHFEGDETPAHVAKKHKCICAGVVPHAPGAGKNQRWSSSRIKSQEGKEGATAGATEKLLDYKIVRNGEEKATDDFVFDVFDDVDKLVDARYKKPYENGYFNAGHYSDRATAETKVVTVSRQRHTKNKRGCHHWDLTKKTHEPLTNWIQGFGQENVAPGKTYFLLSTNNIESSSRPRVIQFHEHFSSQGEQKREEPASPSNGNEDAGELYLVSLQHMGGRRKPLDRDKNEDFHVVDDYTKKFHRVAWAFPAPCPEIPLNKPCQLQEFSEDGFVPEVFYDFDQPAVAVERSELVLHEHATMSPAKKPVSEEATKGSRSGGENERGLPKKSELLQIQMQQQGLASVAERKKNEWKNWISSLPASLGSS
ncbi:unnamed protein product [Amoebophrya sp. A120]|nr:unnamed protein product [Amoebophrya sp. A120]|eukprot:GSA120T00010077001.1